MKPALVVDEKLAKDLRLDDAYVTLFPSLGHTNSWNIPQCQYSLVTKEILAASNTLAKIFAEKYYHNLPYRLSSKECLFNGFGGLLTFLIGDRLIRVNKLLAVSQEKTFSLPPATLNYSTAWSHTHLFYNLIEQDPEFNQWVLNEIFQTWSRLNLETNISLEQSEYFENYLPAEKKAALKQTSWIQKFFRRFRTRLKEGNLFAALIRRISHLIRPKIYSLLYFISSMGKDIPWDGLGPIPDPAYFQWSFLWPRGRLCFRGQDTVSDVILAKEGPSQFSREGILSLSDEIAQVFFELIEKIDGTCHIEMRHLKNIASVFSYLAPRCYIEDVIPQTEAFLEKFKPFSGRCYFSGGTFSGYPSALRVFASYEHNIKVISTQHSAWGGYLANGPLVTEFLIKGCDDYITFGWDNPPEDGSVWRKQAIKLSAPLTSKMFQLKNQRRFKQIKKKILLCPGFIYRFPSIYNSSLRVDNLNTWSNILRDIVCKLAAANISVDVIMYNNVMAQNMKSSLDFWLQGNSPLAQAYKDHDVKVRYILNGDEFSENYDAVVWDLVAGGFVEAVATGIPTFALWNDQLHLGTEVGRPYIDNLKKAGIAFSDGDGLVNGLNNFYQSPTTFTYQNNQALRSFFDAFVKIDSNWKQEWENYFRNLP
jgi:hypothetical protein